MFTDKSGTAREFRLLVRRLGGDFRLCTSLGGRTNHSSSVMVRGGWSFIYLCSDSGALCDVLRKCGIIIARPERRRFASPRRLVHLSSRPVMHRRRPKRVPVVWRRVLSIIAPFLPLASRSWLVACGAIQRHTWRLGVGVALECLVPVQWSNGFDFKTRASRSGSARSKVLNNNLF